jgi:hypothetical protein
MHFRDTTVDYCPIEKQVKGFKLKGKVLYGDGTEVRGWKKKLTQFVEEQELNVDSGNGLPAFVRRLAEVGDLKLGRL